jgi:SAM-dependent methyltransferase
MSARADIYARPDLYDMEYEGANNHDARFFARLLARVRPRRVLELACGSGRVTFTLAAALPMAEIVGVDSSIDMLSQAATARDAAEPLVRERVSLAEGDMRDWPGTGDAFDAVVIACCSVSHLLTLDDRRRTWGTAFRLLRPGGVFILDVRVPDLATLAEAQRVRPRAFVDLDIDATRRTPGEEGRLLRCTATTYEPHLQRADVRLPYERFDERALAERLVSDFPASFLPVQARTVVSVGRLRDRAAVRRLPVRAFRPHVSICGDDGAPATPVKASSVLARSTWRPSARHIRPTVSVSWHRWRVHIV